MKFICLICAEQMMEHLEPADAAGHFAEYAAFTEAIKREGHFISGNRLTPPGTAKTVRVRDGQAHVTDGPFAETREMLGGYYLIEAPDMDTALEIAARIPGAQRGCVEVRPIADDAPTRALSLGVTPPASCSRRELGWDLKAGFQNGPATLKPQADKGG